MSSMRCARTVHAAAGAIMLIAPASAAAVSDQTVHATSAAGAVEIRLGAHRVGFNHELSVSGTAGPHGAGRLLDLELRPGGTDTWQVLRRTRADRASRFSLGAPLRASGQIRVVAPNLRPSTSTSTSTSTSASASPPVDSVSIQPSAPVHVSVAAKLRVPEHQRGVLAGQRVKVTGRLLPAHPGRHVAVLGRSGPRWLKLGSAVTGAAGRFSVSVHPGASGSVPLRVRFRGDSLNTRASAPAGRLTVFHSSVVSWYDDAGQTACGFHARYGVASLSLPCGTHVTMRNGSRSVAATVDDRGPYVGGREFDLNQTTASALGFAGIGTVWTSI